MDLIRIGKTGLEVVVIFIVVYFISLQLQNLSLEPNVSKAFVEFYVPLAGLGLATLFGIAIFKVRYTDEFEFGRTIKFALIAGWILLITVLSFSGTQLIPVPRASAESFQLTGGTELYLASVVPGVLEDLVYLIGLPMIISVAILLFSEFILGIDPSRMMILGVVVLSTFVAAIGYNVFVVPGFATAHVPSYGASNPGLFAAFFFAWGQSLVYVFGGVFIPLAHIIHNAIIFQSAQVGLSVGPLAITGGA